MTSDKRQKRWLIAATQSLVSICLVGWMFFYIDFTEIFTLELFSKTNIVRILFCTVLLAALIIPASIRWRWFISRCAFDVAQTPSLGIAIRINSINVALNQFLPSTLGGDLYRVLIAKSLGLPLLRSMAATVADRLSAFVVLIIIAGPALVITLTTMGELLSLARTTVWLLFAGIIFCGFVGWIASWKYTFGKAGRSFLNALRLWIWSEGLLSRVVLTSAFIQLTTLAVMVGIATIMGVEIGMLSLSGVMTASLLASRLPISVAGWGVREGVLVSFLGAFGVTSETALATSIIFGLTELSAAMLALSISSAAPIFIRFFPTQLSSSSQ